MKKFLSIFIVMILLVSMIGIVTAFAGASISGYSTVSAGRSYTYKGTASYSAGDIICKIEGLGQVSSGFAGAGGTGNQSLTATASIRVTIPASANPGETFNIKFSGSYSIMKADGSGQVESEKNFTVNKTITVGVPSTRDPNATPTPLEGWEIVQEAVDDAEDGAVVQAAMEDDYKIPEELLKELIERKITLVVDFGTYKVTIDPAMLTEFDDIGSLDLSLMFEKVAGLSEIAGEMDLYQLHFGYSGELPGMLAFTFEASENVPGDIVFLYYYYGEANVLEGKASALVDENGMVTFEIYHCSSYFVTGEILPAAMSNFDSESALALVEMAAELELASTTISETQTALDESIAQVTKLDDELAAAQAALDAELEAEPEEAEAAAEPEKEAFGISLVVFIAALVAVLLLSILLTMMFCRAGLFKRVVEIEAEPEPEPEEDAAEQKSDGRQSRQQAKRDAMGAKQLAKQDALDAKHEAKLNAQEAKEQAKRDAIYMKAQMKQDAVDIKAQAKQDAVEAKQDAIDMKAQAKQDAVEAKRLAKEEKQSARDARKNAKERDSDMQV